MVKKTVKRGISLALIFGLIVCWNALPLADEWGRMHIQRFEPRRDPPKVSLKSLDGKKVVLEEFKGKVVFLNFWTTWCGYCRREMPSMEKLYKDFREKGFTILAVDVRESAEKVRPFLDRYNLTFPTVLDPTGKAAFLFGVRGYPATFLLDRTGKVVGSAPGARDWYSDDAKALISKLLAEKGSEVKGAQGEENVGAKAGPRETGVLADEEEKKIATFDLNSIVGPPAHSQGQTTVKGAQVFDLDEGAVGDERAADFSWAEVGLTSRFFIPQNGAEYSHKGIVDQVTFDDIILARYSSSPINGSEGEKNRLKPGTILYARTNEGRLACLRVESNGRDLEISWVTYEKD